MHTGHGHENALVAGIDFQVLQIFLLPLVVPVKGEARCETARVDALQAGIVRADGSVKLELEHAACNVLAHRCCFHSSSLRFSSASACSASQTFSTLLGLSVCHDFLARKASDMLVSCCYAARAGATTKKCRELS